MAQPTKDGSTQVLQTLQTNQNSFILPNYDYVNAFYRAVKVGLISYPEHTNTSPPSYQNVNLFVREMRALYGVQAIDNTLIRQQYDKIKNEDLGIFVKAKRFRGRDNVTNPRLVATIKPNSLNAYLNPFQEIQTMNPIRLPVKCDTFRALRRTPTQQLVISVEGDIWKKT